MIAFTESNRHLIPAKRDRHLQNDRASSEKAIASSSLIPTKRDRHFQKIPPTFKNQSDRTQISQKFGRLG